MTSVTKTLEELIIFTTTATNNPDPVTREGLPHVSRQHLLQEQYAACYSLLTTHKLPLTIYHLTLTTHYSLLTYCRSKASSHWPSAASLCRLPLVTSRWRNSALSARTRTSTRSPTTHHYSLAATYYLLPATQYLTILTTRYLLPTAHYPMPTVYNLLTTTAYYPLPTSYYLRPAASSQGHEKGDTQGHGHGIAGKPPAR